MPTVPSKVSRLMASEAKKSEAFSYFEAWTKKKLTLGNHNDWLDDWRAYRAGWFANKTIEEAKRQFQTSQ